MKNVHKLTQYSYELCKQFYKDERGVYMYLGGMLGFVLLGLAALAVDGSGIYLDKARFVQGMDQAALALAAENNTKCPDITKTIGNKITRENRNRRWTRDQWKENIIFKQLLRDFLLHRFPFLLKFVHGLTLVDNFT